MNALFNTINLELAYTNHWIERNDLNRATQDVVAWLMDIQFLIGLYRKADTAPRLKYFAHARRQFSPYFTYNMVYAMLRDGKPVREIYANKLFAFDAIDAAIKSARDNGLLSKPAVQTVKLACCHCKRSEVALRTVTTFETRLMCTDCYEDFYLD